MTDERTLEEQYNHAPGATSWKLSERDDPIWWRFWGPTNADLIGVPLEGRP